MSVTGKAYKIAVIPGDGIGREVMPEALRMLEAVAQRYGFALELESFEWAGCNFRNKTGHMLPPNWVEVLTSFDAILFGAVSDPKRYPDHVTLWESLLLFRRQFDQYVSLRPCRVIPGVPSPLKNSAGIDMWIVRENTEGEYSEIGGRIFHGTDREMASQQTVMTRTGVDRIIKYAFELAQSRPKKHLTSATKSNGISITMPYWDERFRAIARQYPDVRTDQFHIDALTAKFVENPQFFDVVVGSNLLGDILSDLAPALCGSLGLAPSGNINADRTFPSLFEPVHGSAPDIAGKGVANPVGQSQSAAQIAGDMLTSTLPSLFTPARHRRSCSTHAATPWRARRRSCHQLCCQHCPWARLPRRAHEGRRRQGQYAGIGGCACQAVAGELGATVGPLWSSISTLSQTRLHLATSPSSHAPSCSPARVANLVVAESSSSSAVCASTEVPLPPTVVGNARKPSVCSSMVALSAFSVDP